MTLPCALGLLCTLTLTSTFASPTFAQAPDTALTLPTAVDLALRHSPVVQAKEREYAATRANEITAGLRPNPTASYSAEQLGNANVDQQHTVALSQPIELGGKRQRRIESAQAASRVNELELADVRRQVTAQVKKAFTDVQAAVAVLKLATENLRGLDEVERVNRLRAEKGDIAELELLRIQVQRFAFERDLGDARQALDVARITLRAAIGVDAVAREFDVAGELVFREVPLDRERLLERSLAARPDVRAADAARTRARADLNLARANAWWDIAPQVQYQRIGPDNTFGLGISIPLRVFDRNQGEIARTRAEIERAAYQRDAAVVQVRTEVETALAVVLNEREKVRQLNELYLPRAARARDTVDYAYRRGGLSVLDLLDAQRTYRETALDSVRALSNYWIAIYQLEAAVGGPLEP
jgi:outer membrane protein, heavy metal efflux system